MTRQGTTHAEREELTEPSTLLPPITIQSDNLAHSDQRHRCACESQSVVNQLRQQLRKSDGLLARSGTSLKKGQVVADFLDDFPVDDPTWDAEPDEEDTIPCDGDPDPSMI